MNILNKRQLSLLAWAGASPFCLWTLLTGFWWTVTGIYGDVFSSMLILSYFLLLYGVKNAPIFTKLLCHLGALFMMGSVFAAPLFDSITIGAIGFSLCFFWGVTFGLFWE